MNTETTNPASIPERPEVAMTLHGTVYNAIGGTRQTVTVEVEGLDNESIIDVPMGVPATLIIGAALPSIPERPDLRTRVEAVIAAWEREPVWTRGDVIAGLRAILGSIPERPAEPLREALTTILALAEGEAPLLEHYRREIERVARAALALQSTPESRPLTCHADGSPCDICAILVGKESPR